MVVLGVMSVVVVLVEGAEGFIFKTSELCQNSNLVTFMYEKNKKETEVRTSLWERNFRGYHFTLQTYIH